MKKEKRCPCTFGICDECDGQEETAEEDKEEPKQRCWREDKD